MTTNHLLATAARDLSIQRQIVRRAWKTWAGSSYFDPKNRRYYETVSEGLQWRAIFAIKCAFDAGRDSVAKTIVRLYL